jgi:O-acetyl-ADP-ribose deacetylase (regulator of RNase III)
MINRPVDYVNFWTPVDFTGAKTPGTSYLTDALWRLGSLADQYAYLGQKTLHVQVEHIHAQKISCVVKEIETISMKNTALKVSSYFLTLFILLPIAFIAKIIFKIYLNSCLFQQNEIIAEKQIGKTKVVLKCGSLFCEKTEGVVNPANHGLQGRGGVSGLFYVKAGEEPFIECAEILSKLQKDAIDSGDAVMTTSGDLAPRVKVIIHTAGPIFDEKNEEENAKQLAKAYTRSLNLLTAPQDNPNWISSKVDAKPMRTISLPSISTGIYGYPLDKAAPIALQSVKDFITKNPDALDEVDIVFLPLEKDPQKTSLAYKEALEKL